MVFGRSGEVRQGQLADIRRRVATNTGNRMTNRRQMANRKSQRISDGIERVRAIQLGRGNLLVQKGAFATQDEWSDLRADHEACMTRVSRWLNDGERGR